MKTICQAAGAFAFVCLGLLFLSLQSTVAYFPRYMVESRHSLFSEVRETRAAAEQLPERILPPVLAVVDRQSAAAIQTVNDQVGMAVTAANERLEQAVAAADQRLGGAIDAATSEFTGIRSDLKPTLEHVASTAQHADEASAILFRRDALPAQILGLVAATKVTMGQTASTMRDFQQAAPGLLLSAKKIGDNSDLATAKTVAAAEESRRLLHNLADNTTPLPKFIRYPAQIIGLVGSAAVPVLTLQRLSQVGTASTAIVQVSK